MCRICDHREEGCLAAITSSGSWVSFKFDDSRHHLASGNSGVKRTATCAGENFKLHINRGQC